MFDQNLGVEGVHKKVISIKGIAALSRSNPQCIEKYTYL